MSAEILKGAPVAAALNEKSKEICAGLKLNGIIPCLAIVRVGGKGDDIAYERGILKRCSALEVESERTYLCHRKSEWRHKYPRNTRIYALAFSY